MFYKEKETPVKKNHLIAFIFLTFSTYSIIKSNEYIFIFSASLFALIAYSETIYKFLKEAVEDISISIGNIKIEFTKKLNRALRKRRICKKKKQKKNH